MSLFPTYNRYDIAIESADGTLVTDVNGKEYLDFGSGIGVCNLGHRHEKVQERITEQLNSYWHVSNLYKQPIQEKVAQKITQHSVGDYVFFCNSGAEANEAAIKLARKATGKSKIISFTQSFHGRTFATMAATGQEKVREGFGKMLESFQYATFNDIDSVKQLIDDETAGVMLEVVQGEGGVIPAEEQFLQKLQTLCKENGVLLMIDEIQTGIGRTGKKFGYEHYGIDPDIFTLAKGLGNGLPIGAMVAKADYVDAFGPGSHASTFGGNPVAMSAADAVTDIVFSDSFLQTVNEKANYLQEVLQSEIAPLPFVKEVRQKGMMVGIECRDEVSALVPKIMEQGVLVLVAGPNVCRLLPPLTVTKEEIAVAVKQIKTVLQEVE